MTYIINLSRLNIVWISPHLYSTISLLLYFLILTENMGKNIVYLAMSEQKYGAKIFHMESEMYSASGGEGDKYSNETNRTRRVTYKKRRKNTK